jgi:hypothetical protein
MPDEFTIESRTVEAIRVRQVRHNHRYIFTVQKLRGRRLLWTGPIFGNAKASVPAMMLMGAARNFAEREARKAEMIDWASLWKTTDIFLRKHFPVDTVELQKEQLMTDRPTLISERSISRGQVIHWHARPTSRMDLHCESATRIKLPEEDP